MVAPAGGNPSSTVLLNHDTASIYLHSTPAKRVLNILHQIEWLDVMLHEERCQLPTVTEFSLYVLIHRHVDLYIQLFQSEDLKTVIRNCSRKIGLESTHLDKKMHIGETNMDGSSRSAEEVLDDLLNKMDDIERHLPNIWSFLRKCRKSLLQASVYSLKFAIEGIKLTDIDSGGFEMMESNTTDIDSITKGLNNHENELDHHEKSASSTDNDVGPNWHTGDKGIDIKLLLRRILIDVLDIGRSRSYAPPSEIEMEHYRQIRTRIASSLAYAKAKTLSQRSRRFRGKKLQSAHTSNAVSKEEWFSTRENDYVYQLEYHPRSRSLANMLDYLPGILSLLQECKDHASSCSSSFYKYIKGMEHGSLLRLTKQQEEFDAKVCQELEVHDELEKDKNELLGTANFATENNYSTFCESKTRTECLLEMLDMFKKLKSSFTTKLSVEEVRLLAQINEHADSSIWLFHNVKVAHLDQKVQVQTRYGESKSREDYLRKILVLVEAIRRSCLDIPPNNNEGQLYEKLNKYVSDVFCNTNTRALIKGRKRKVDDYAPSDQNYIDDLLKYIYWWQMKWFQKVESEFVNMLKAIIPSFCQGLDQSDNGLACLSENMKANMVPEVVKMFEKEFSDSAQQKLKLLDECLLLLHKAMKLLDAVLQRIDVDNYRLNNLRSSRNSGLLWEEVSSVCQVMSRSNI